MPSKSLKPNYALRDRWLEAMRASTLRASGQEMDFASAEGEADRFDPLGLLAFLKAGDKLFKFTSENMGGWVPMRTAALLAWEIGLPEKAWRQLALANDDPRVSWETMADYASQMCEEHDRGVLHE